MPHGKWSQSGVPHRGWQCIDRYDSCGDGEALHKRCQMCERQHIRYVHVMEHPGHPEQLECGCKCAENMAEGYDGKAHERALKRAAAKRRRDAARHQMPDRAARTPPQVTSRSAHAFNPGLIRWRESSKGNLWAHTHVGVITIYLHQGTWRVAVRGDRGSKFYKHQFDSCAEAQKRVMASLEKHWQRRDNTEKR